MQEFFCIHWLKCRILSSQVMWIWWNYTWKSMGTNRWLLPKGFYAYIQTSVYLLHCLHTLLHWQTHFHAPNLLPVWSLCTNYSSMLLKILIFLVHINFEYLKWSQTVWYTSTNCAFLLCLACPNMLLIWLLHNYFDFLSFHTNLDFFVVSVFLNCIIQGRALR